MSDSLQPPRTVACQAPLSSTISWSLLKFMSTELVMLANHLILCHPLHFLPSTFSSIRVFSSESPNLGWPYSDQNREGNEQRKTWLGWELDLAWTWNRREGAHLPADPLTWSWCT